jgi:hypothetical protein
VIEVVRGLEEQLSGYLRELSRTIDLLEAEIAGAQRFATDAKLARAGGIAPIPVSSGDTNRHGLDRGGNRQINTAIHRRRVSRARCHAETKAYLQRKRTEGNTHREAIRCLKRHLAAPSGTCSNRQTRRPAPLLSTSIS